MKNSFLCSRLTSGFLHQLTIIFCTVALLGFLDSCANIGTEQDNDLTLDRTVDDVLPITFAETKVGKTPFIDGKAKHQSSWIACNHATPEGAVVIMQGDLPAFEPETACKNWVSQAFLTQKYSVLIVAHPGAMGASGNNDLGGPLTIAGATAAIKAATLLSKPVLKGRLLGIWGYGSGAGVAALTARQLGGVKFLILGGGFYDYEDLLVKTNESGLKRDIEAIKKYSGDHGLEFRSVAYDVSKLPPQIALYHAKLDTIAPPSQSKSFSDSLKTSGDYKVSFQSIEGFNHEIPNNHHQEIIAVLLRSVQQK